MEFKKRYFFVLLLVFLSIPSVIAPDILKPAKVNETYTILQTCATCTSVNITISNVDGIIIANQAMTSNGTGVWTYDITPTTLSRHDITGQGDINGVPDSFVTFFEVTGSGKVATTGDSVLYALFSFVLFGAIFLISFLVFTMPSRNPRDEQGFENKILKIKYVRIIFIFLIWPLTILLLNFLNGLAVNFSGLTFFSGILGFLFETMMRLSWVFTVIIIAWIVVMLVHDTNVNKLLKKFDQFDPSNP